MTFPKLVWRELAQGIVHSSVLLWLWLANLTCMGWDKIALMSLTQVVVGSPKIRDLEADSLFCFSFGLLFFLPRVDQCVDICSLSK